MILGVDVGTSVTKASLLGRDGTATVTHGVRSTLRRLPGGRVEQDLDEVLETVLSVVRSVAAEADEPIEALAITGQGDGLWLRDREGHQVGPAISWLDARASSVLDRWHETGVLRRVHELTGAGMFPGSAGPLLAHLAEHDPERLERAEVAGYCVDAIIQRLTGEITVDASDASLPFLDVPTRTYSAEALAACGLESHRRLLAEPAPPGKLFGLDGSMARQLGLPSGLPVSAGPFDLPACALGAGIDEVGDGTLVIGTTLGCQVLRDEVGLVPGAEIAGMWLATPRADRFLRVMPAMVGTANLDWVLAMVGADVGELETLLGNSEPGAGGVSALSFLSSSGERAPFVEPRARGQFTGLSLETRPADLVRAMCEAVAYAARHNLEAAGLTGTVSACGGGAQSAAWSQIFADVLGRPLHVPHEQCVGGRGAAMTAWDSLGEPVDRVQWAADRHVVQPHPRAVEFYERGYRDYLAAIDRARPGWQATAKGRQATPKEAGE
ncbi:xylulokinase/erythritol kinase [Saccharopolyspora erythraea NRRL 2338]|uniref:Erythritol kinase protein n=2 Tax=Saccharopolyspora erythraea TaxID=1836 RepID=A4FK84_SACEN|nr:FGGY-family carbohydrate kinase [Saccharopolyspora erythraea]EQD85258.1 erythritol kinase [Saccharopolyspora erythraea D]PFG98097.1 xylulokinase/erythritol kinase [Saccharopolyspora erythraea NRRL 2338]QRK88207.1 carbohydrate kinase [Saccharopolyspora erythraea]CAM04459.1 putative erythritol kinase protein [Saccharopolyspora erythraea NRRL 2338]